MLDATTEHGYAIDAVGIEGHWSYNSTSCCGRMRVEPVAVIVKLIMLPLIINEEVGWLIVN